MKTELTIEESNLLELRGIRSASKWVETKDTVGSYKAPIFTLADLLSLLPRTVIIANTRTNKPQDYHLQIEGYSNHWDVGYYSFMIEDYATEVERKSELIDALYELVLWCINNGYLKV